MTDEISKTMALLFKGVHELRVLNAGRSGISSGYFLDPEKATEWARKYSKDPSVKGIYMTINPCDPACLARSPEACKPYAKTTTNDNEILRRYWLPIDCDAKRVADVSATDEEKAAAGAVTSRVHDYLREEGFTGLVLADSGNGWHILIPIDLPNPAKGRIA